MSTTTFVDGSTPVVADWLNDVDATVYQILGDGTNAPTTAAEVLTNIGGVNSADIGVTIQAHDATLDTLAATTPTAAGIALLEDADAAAQRTTLGLGTAATTDSTAYATAAQGTLADTAVQPAALATKQDTLVSGTNIKTVNGSSLLGSGDLAVSASISDGDKGDITVSSSGTVWTVDAGAITAGKLSGSQSGSAPLYGARAWVKFDGTRNVTDTGASTNGNPVKIYASGNVSSVTKNATGDYTVNFTTSLPSADYAVSPFFRTTSVVNLFLSRSRIAAPTAAAFRLDVYNSSVVAQDCEEVYLTFTC